MKELIQFIWTVDCNHADAINAWLYAQAAKVWLKHLCGTGLIAFLICVIWDIATRAIDAQITLVREAEARREKHYPAP